MTNYYTTEKVGKRHTNILVAGTREHVCQLQNKEVARWMHGAEAAKVEEVTYAIERYEWRLATVTAYLAVRAARKVETDRQGNLF